MSQSIRIDYMNSIFFPRQIILYHDMQSKFRFYPSPNPTIFIIIFINIHYYHATILDSQSTRSAVRTFFIPNMLATTSSSPISNPLFCKFNNWFTTDDPKKSFRWPSVVTSPRPISSAVLAVAQSCQSLILSISSSNHDRVFVPAHCLLHNNAIIRSFSSRASVSHDISPLGRNMVSK